MTARPVPQDEQARLASLVFSLMGEEIEASTCRSQFAALDEGDWTWLDRCAAQHRLIPYLYFKASQAAIDLHPSLAEDWHRQSRDAMIDSLAHMAELARLARMLGDAGLTMVALKGAYLDAFAYPKPGLRPMRDIDLWLPQNQLISAFRVLQGHGYRRDAGDHGDLSAILNQSHQLPVLVHEDGRFQVELHARLFHGGGPDLSEEADFLHTTVEQDVAGHTVRFASPTYQLLHLIVHAARDHQFDNGPQILPDMAHLITTTSIDWTKFWECAERFGERATATLLLFMVRRCWPDLSIALTPEQIGGVEEIVPIAHRLMVQDLQQHGAANLIGRVDRRLFWSNLFPSRDRLAALYGRHSGRFASLIFHWRRLATERMPILWQGRANDAAQRQAAVSAQYRAWLNQQLRH